MTWGAKGETQEYRGSVAGKLHDPRAPPTHLQLVLRSQQRGCHAVRQAAGMVVYRQQQHTRT
jgi:hypothetical protein